MYVIGLTGGIASGKSVVASRLAEHGAVIVDGDRLAREVVEPGTAGLAAIRQRFGDQVIAPDGTLNRPALGAIVFADENARLDLNAITHPAIRELTVERIAAARAADPDVVIVQDIPLLAETFHAGTARNFDTIVVVDAPVELRERRLVELRGMSLDDARGRISSQASDDDRRAIADIVIDSSGTLDHTLEQVDALWASVSRPA